jgi:hypothetical protein
VVPEPEYVDAFRFQRACPLGITPRLFRKCMDAAIEINRESRCMTVKIHDKTSMRMLAAEFHPL